MLYKRFSLPFILIMMAVLVVPIFIVPQSANAQTAIDCGQRIRAEFTKNNEEHVYTFMGAPEDTISGKATRVGKNLRFDYKILDPAGNSILYTNFTKDEISFDDVILSSTGQYKIVIRAGSGVGTYNFYFNCKRAKAAPTKPAAGKTQAPVAPVFSGVGFPGLSPVDFSKVVKVKLPSDGKVEGEISPTGGEVLGFTFSAKANDVFDLAFTRTAGNLNLGLAVLSANNKVAFFAAVVTSDMLTTRFKLPAEGQYTIGVFRIDLLPPAKPEATAFQIVGKLNPK